MFNVSCIVVVEMNQFMVIRITDFRELDAMSGAWFYTKYHKSKRNRKTNKFITGGELVRSSFKKRSHAEMSGKALYIRLSFFIISVTQSVLYAVKLVFKVHL